MKNLLRALALLLFATGHSAFSQENIFTAGFQYKPIFPSSFFSTGTKTDVQNGIDFSVTQKSGYCAGMIIRRGFTKRLSLETGINYVKRNFMLSIKDSTFTGNSYFKIIGYEIPVHLLIFMQASKNSFFNASMGVSCDMYPTNVSTRDSYFKHNGYRNSVFQLAATANLGYEIRTEKSGYFYLGASYHLPSAFFYLSSITYTPTKDIGHIKLGGNYLTVDFRYYFHEDPMKPKKKKKKEK